MAEKILYSKDGLQVAATDWGVGITTADGKTFQLKKEDAPKIAKAMAMVPPPKKPTIKEGLGSIREYLAHKQVAEYVAEYEKSGNVSESILGRALGALTGATLGTKVGAAIARVLGVEKGHLYDLLTSKIVGASIGQEIMKNVI